MKPRPRILALIALASLAAGCGKPETPPQYSSYIPAAAKEATPTPYQLTLVRTIDAKVKALRSIAIDRQDRLYLLGDAGLRVLDADGAEVARFTPPEEAFAVAVDDCSTVYLGAATRVITWRLGAKTTGGWPVAASPSGKPARITGLALAPDSLLVADFGALCIHRYALNGDLIADIGKKDLSTNFVGIVAPSPYIDVKVDNESRLVVTNPGRLRVETYSLDGRLLGFWGKSGLAPGSFEGCCNPTNLALAREGWVVTSEKGEVPRVKASDRAGNLLALLGPGDIKAREPGLSLAVDSKNRIYVAATDTGNVLVFELTPRKETP